MHTSKIIKSITKEVLELLDPNTLYQELFTFELLKLKISNFTLDMNEGLHIYALGKSASFESKALKSLLELKGYKDKVKSIISYTKDGHTVKDSEILQLEGTHPLISKVNLENTLEFIRRLETIKKNESLIFLLSGGGSALLELPIDNLSFEELLLKHKEILNSGENINRMNHRRKSLSLVKNGGLLKYISTKNILQLITCDIPNEDLFDVSSGPLLSKTSPKFNPKTLMVQSASLFLKKLCSKEGRILGKVYDCNLASLEADLMKSLPVKGKMHISGGEAPLVLPPQHGKGGRNTHFVLSFAKKIYQKKENQDIKILSLGTDGGDGPTDAAGAFIDFDTYCSLNPIKFLENFDTYSYFEKVGTLIKTGPTKTNVMDLRCIWRE